MEEQMQPRRGRPSSFNQERAHRLISAVRGGNYLNASAQFAGISYGTLQRWLHKADDPDAPEEYRIFRDEILKAQADAEVSAVATIRKAGNEGSWQATAWWLERSKPERWSKKDTSTVEMQITGAGGGPVKIVAGMELTPEGMSALANRLAQRLAENKADQDISDADIIEEPLELDPVPLDPEDEPF